MEKPELMKRFEKLVDQAEREDLWGSVEIEFRNGHATLIRTHKTEPLDDNAGGTRRHDYRK